MRRALAIALLSTALMGGLAAPAMADPGTARSSIRIVGTATTTDAYGSGVYTNTTIRLRLEVVCPRGDTGYIPFAGLAEYGPSATPYLPGNTAPVRVTCTGRPQPASTVARSISRLQNPQTHPFTYFESGVVTARVQLGVGAALASSTRKVRVVVPA